MRPRITLHNRQRAVRAADLGLPRLREALAAALPHALAAAGARSALRTLDEIGIVLVSDRNIAAIHGRFLADPSPTDVITFEHGEILVSAETAAREAAARGLSLTEELARYAVHGLLHLAGWDDLRPAAARAMHRRQEKILRRALAGLC